MAGRDSADGIAGLQGAVRALVHATSRVRGQAFLKMMTRGIANLLGVRYVHVATVDPDDPSRAAALAAWNGSDFADGFSYELAGSPCEQVLAHDTCWYPDDVQQLHPDDKVLVEMGVRAYLGTPLRNRNGRPLGLLAVMDTEPMTDDRGARMLLDLFVARAAAELELAIASRHSPSAGGIDEERRQAYVDEAVGATFTFDFDPPMPVDLPAERQVDWMLENARLSEVNDAGAKMWNYADASEPIGITWREVFGENVEPGRQVLHAAISAGYRWDAVEHHVQLPDGKYHWFLVSGQGVVEDGKVLRFRGTLYEITEQRRAENARERARADFLRFAERSPAAIYRYRLSPDPGFLYVNRGAAEISGYTVDELYADPRLGLEIVHPDDRHLLQEMQRDPGTHSSKPLRWLRKDGSVRWIEHQTTVVQEDDGNVSIVEGIGHDITDRRRAEEELRAALEEITALKEQLTADNVVLRAEVSRSAQHGGIVGHDGGLREVLTEAKQVAGVDSAVLLLGETGTGKEMLARAIHDWSSRRERPMISLNCAAIPASLVESELFGREKGAYTGALSRQAGRFEAADGSTLFLDEVGELPLEAQGKLLRVLEEGRYERLGSTQTHATDVRIVAATNRDLKTEVARGRFRQDLFFRLNVYPIVLPPLRDRREDIPDLVWHFVRELGTRMGKTFEEIHGPSLAALQRHPWPGNVRELRNVVERAMIRSNESVLRIETPTVEHPGADAAVTLDEAQRRHIVDALERTGWKVRGPDGAAALLGLKPTTLDSKMRKLDIRRPE